MMEPQRKAQTREGLKKTRLESVMVKCYYLYSWWLGVKYTIQPHKKANKLGLSCAKLSTAKASYPITRSAYSASCGWRCQLG